MGSWILRRSGIRVSEDSVKRMMKKGMKPDEALDSVNKMQKNARSTESCFDSSKYLLAEKLSKYIKEAKTTAGSKDTACKGTQMEKQAEAIPDPVYGKRMRAPTISPPGN